MSDQADQDYLDLVDNGLPEVARAVFRAIAAIDDNLACGARWADLEHLHYKQKWKDGEVEHTFYPSWRDNEGRGGEGSRNFDTKVVISQLRPTDVESVTVGKANVSGGSEENTSRSLDTIVNAGSEKLESETNWEQLVEDEETKHKELGYGFKAAQELTARFKAATGPAASAFATAEKELEVKASLEQSIDKRMGKDNRSLTAIRRAKNRKYVAAPFTILDVILENSVKAVRIDIEARGVFDCKVHVWGRQPGNHKRWNPQAGAHFEPGWQQYNMTFRSCDELHDVLRGLVADKHGWFSMHYATPTNRMSPDAIREALPRPVVTLKKVIDDDDVLASRVIAKETRLPGHPDYIEGGQNEAVVPEMSDGEDEG